MHGRARGKKSRFYRSSIAIFFLISLVDSPRTLSGLLQDSSWSSLRTSMVIWRRDLQSCLTLFCCVFFLLCEFFGIFRCPCCSHVFEIGDAPPWTSRDVVSTLYSQLLWIPWTFVISCQEISVFREHEYFENSRGKSAKISKLLKTWKKNLFNLYYYFPPVKRARLNPKYSKKMHRQYNSNIFTINEKYN